MRSTSLFFGGRNLDCGKIRRIGKLLCQGGKFIGPGKILQVSQNVQDPLMLHDKSRPSQVI
jgi:hypothetical protein